MLAAFFLPGGLCLEFNNVGKVLLNFGYYSNLITGYLLLFINLKYFYGKSCLR